MDDQRTLAFFDDDEPRRLARRSDPQTSHRAVPSKSSLSETKRLVLDVIGHQSLTANEIAEQCEHDGRNTVGRLSESFRKRVNELARSGHLRIAGTRECTITHARATVYRRA